ncbi:MAG: DUF5662 family protein [Eubacteriales bacterium]|nr:DUF5662 family protein [Eubacteriales bacterium]
MESYAYQTKTFSQRFFGHLRTVCTHKFYVAQGCFKCGLYYQGLLHDLSKFSPQEFMVGVKYFDGHKSPNAVQRTLNDGCSTSWLHHKGRNRHHFEYWIDYSVKPGMTVYGNRMPMKYVAEMVCDRRAACITYQGKDYSQASAWEHYQFSKKRIIMHADTRAVLEKCLAILKDEGEEACFGYIRELLKITKGADYTAEQLGLKKEEVEVTF